MGEELKNRSSGGGIPDFSPGREKFQNQSHVCEQRGAGEKVGEIEEGTGQGCGDHAFKTPYPGHFEHKVYYPRTS